MCHLRPIRHQSPLGVPSTNCVMKVGVNDSSVAPDKRECGCLTHESLFNLALLLLCG